MGKTSIEWVRNADGSQGWAINPIRARNKETSKAGHYCEKISAGCKNCYASRMQSPYLSQLEYIAENRDKVELYFDDAAIQQVIRRKKPTTFFWCDMTDLFGDWVPDEWIDRCLLAMALTPQHRHMLLTKRPGRMRACFTAKRGHFTCEYIHVPATSVSRLLPLANVWLGVSCENQEAADARIPLLLQTPAAVRFISAEPLLGPVDLKHIEFRRATWYDALENHDGFGLLGAAHQKLDWVIVGGESGPGARAMCPEWARSIRDQCQASGVPYFHKQNGEWAPFHYSIKETEFMDVPAGDGTHHRMFRVGKKAAGRLLDGREWNEFPSVRVPESSAVPA